MEYPKVELQELIDKITFPVLIVDNSGSVKTANWVALEHLGKSKKDITEKPGGEVISCESVPIVLYLIYIISIVVYKVTNIL